MKATSFVAVAALAAAVSAAPLTESQYQFLFTRFVSQYEKSYESNSFFSKYNTFKANLDTILAHNANQENTFTMGMNQFGDLTTEEFSQLMTLGKNVYVPKEKVEAPCPYAAAAAALATKDAQVDWRSKMNPVKNQASCGSCWAFAAIAGIEGSYAVKYGKILDLSEQQLVDCDKASSGCNGGLMSHAYDYLENNRVKVCAQSDYPYTARNGSCRSCNGSVTVASHSAGIVNEDLLTQSILSQPVPVALAASASAFQFYKSGVLDDKRCGTGLNHAVLAVGYGPATGSEKAYIKIRNSWGSAWGDKGYIRFAYGENICGLGNSISGGYDYVPVY